MTPRDRAADLRLRREFHTTLAEYNKILAHQNKRCAICKKPRQPGKKRLALDHCHASGLVRGILCHWCNKMLGMFHLNVAKLEAALMYLLFPPAVQVLGERCTAPGRLGTKKRAALLRAMKQTSIAGGK